MEQRKNPRVGLRVLCDLTIREKTFRVSTTNASLNGVFVHARIKARPGEPCLLTLLLRTAPVTVQGSISRVEKTGTAIEIQNMSIQDEKILCDVLVRASQARDFLADETLKRLLGPHEVIGV